MKTANELASEPLKDDNEYYRSIKDAAETLVKSEKGHYQYVTHYTSGYTIWRDGHRSVGVTREGTINY